MVKFSPVHKAKAMHSELQLEAWVVFILAQARLYMLLKQHIKNSTFTEVNRRSAADLRVETVDIFCCLCAAIQIFIVAQNNIK